MAAVRARTSLDALDGWLPAWAGQHLRSGAEMLQRFHRYPEAVANAARLGTELAFPLRLIAPNLPPFPVPDGHDEMSFLRELAYAGAAERYGPRTERTERAYRQIEHELAIIDELGFPGLLPGGLGPHRVLPAQGHPGPGPGQRGQLRGLLRDRDHRGGLGEVRPALRALPRPGTGRAARHRHRHRVRPAGGGDPVRLRQARPPARRPGRQRDQLPAPLGGARHRPGARLLPGPAGRLEQADRPRLLLGRPAAGTAATEPTGAEPAGPSRHRAHRAGHREHPGAGAEPGRPAAERPAAPGHPLRRHGDLRPSGDRGLPGRVGPDARPHRPAVGQGRLRRHRPGQVRPARARHALGAEVLLRLRRAVARQAVRPARGAGRGSEGVRHAVRRRHDRRVPGRVPGPDGHPAPAAAAQVLRPGHRDRADPARADPGQFGASLHPAQERPGARRLPASEAGEGAAQDPRHPAVPGAADATGHRRGRLHARPRPTRSGGRWAPSAARSGWRRCATSSTTACGPTASPGLAADDIYQKIQAFAAFGFAESHAISFAFLVYASAWLKLYYPASFCAALLNAQPMGFYSPQSLVHDAKRHGVAVRGPDINASGGGGQPGGARRASPATPARARRNRPSGSGCPACKTIGTELAATDRGRAGGRRRLRQHGRTRPPDRPDRRPAGGAGHRRRVRLASAPPAGEALWTAGAAADYRPGQLDLAAATRPPRCRR